MNVEAFQQQHKIIKAIVRGILEDPLKWRWSIQGFGMLRLYLGGKDLRLHVWDDRFKVAGVSEMHTHPWHFHSYVVAGIVENYRYIEAEFPYRNPNSADKFMRQLILCGEGGGLKDDNLTSEVFLLKQPREILRESDHYTQTANEIHVSSPRPGSITIIEREFLGDEDHAYVFWPVGEEWVTAEPRAAKSEEVTAICANSLKEWF